MEGDLDAQVLSAVKATKSFFGRNAMNIIPSIDSESYNVRRQAKIHQEYGGVKATELSERPTKRQRTSSDSNQNRQSNNNELQFKMDTDKDSTIVLGSHPFPSSSGVSLSSENAGTTVSPAVRREVEQEILEENQSKAIVAANITDYRRAAGSAERMKAPSRAIVQRRGLNLEKPQWHAPWKLMRVISGHLGWVRSVAVEPGNEWFATGSADRTIKIWDLASGTLKLSLTGHISAPRALAVSSRSPYLFSAGEDKMVRCWDLEQNQTIRSYHGHLSGVYCLALHPTLDILVTGGRDSCARVWDIRTKTQIHCLGGHRSTVYSVLTEAMDPQIISGSMDSTIKTWDLVSGKCSTTLTNHKKGIRAMAMHPKQAVFASAAADNVKKWKLPEGTFFQNFTGHNSILNTLALNSDDVLMTGGDDGSICMWDWKTGYNFQRLQTIPQPGSLDCEACVYAATFDQTGSRLITCEADKTIKVWKEDEDATPETHPVKWEPTTVTSRW